MFISINLLKVYFYNWIKNISFSDVLKFDEEALNSLWGISDPFPRSSDLLMLTPKVRSSDSSGVQLPCDFRSL